MTPSIPIAEFVNPKRGSRAWNAINRAIDLQPSVVLIGEFKDERWYRVRAKGRDRRCVILWYSHISQQEVGRCDCEASYVPISGPTHCYHLASCLIYEAALEAPKLASMGRAKNATSNQ